MYYLENVGEICGWGGVFCKTFVVSKKNLENILSGDCDDKSKAIFNNLNIKIEKVVFQKQEHTANIEVIDSNFLNKKRNIILNNDALVTNNKDLYLCTYTADCVPVMMYDSERRVVGAIHSCWKGTLALIVQKTAILMNRRFGIDYKKLNCYLGSSINKCCYEVGLAKDNRISKFIKTFGSKVINRDNNKVYLNLPEAIIIQLEALGVKRANIMSSQLCTCCDKKNLPSYYRDGEKHEEAILSIIGIKNYV